jgi:hypothetical protein
MLQDEEARHQPRREPGLAWTRLAHRAEAPVEEAPIDLPSQPHQRMAHVDDLIERRTQQILLAIIPWSGHRVFPRRTRPPENHDPPKTGIANCKKLMPRPRFLAKSITPIPRT